MFFKGTKEEQGFALTKIPEKSEYYGMLLWTTFQIEIIKQPPLLFMGIDLLIQHKKSRKNEIRFTTVSSIKQLDFGLQN